MWRNEKLKCVLKEKKIYCKLEEKALDQTLRRTSLRKGYGLDVRLREEEEEDDDDDDDDDDVT
jgi:hypothetical protein